MTISDGKMRQKIKISVLLKKRAINWVSIANRILVVGGGIIGMR